ncbi:MAG TPA: NAD(+) diphosphatase [Microbacterium sp.]|uniref:NAD(+) diphosphatase n=1 Tax=Microbacterium sp. TaxID=51671 RepID=UPI002C63B7A4|nr:NAD(+) diphosphatase [Microbacterium sp.]HWI32133.1 NAD(+) diphosphatase [Microbacterium sp.]
MTVHAHPGQPPLARGELDRRGDEREREGILAAARDSGDTRVLVLRGDEAPLDSPDGSALAYAAPADVADGGCWAFLGREDTGAAVLVAAFPQGTEDPVSAPHGWGALRSVGGVLGAFDAGVFVEGLSLGRWLLDASFCPACGSLTESAKAGWARRCPSCGREHFPRTDPAVIVAIASEDGERLLLGSNALWGGDRYSCFAGFVEAGESLEATVHREVEEEAGVRVTDIRYHGSQAWPYPRSLMVGFLATAVDDSEAEADGTEIIQVSWFTRTEIGDALEGRGGITLPGAASIARSLIVAWHAGIA